MANTIALQSLAQSRVRPDISPVEPILSKYWSTRFWHAFSWYTVLFKNLHKMENKWADRQMNHALEKIVQDLKARNASYRDNWYAVPEIKTDSMGSPEIRSMVDASKPFVVRGGAKHWEAVKKWNLDYFEAQFGDQTLTAKTDLMDSGEFEERRIRDIVADLRAGKQVYSGFAEDIILKNPEVMVDINRKDILDMMGVEKDRNSSMINFFRDGTIASIQMFIQGSKSHTTFHMTKFHNFFVELQGRKEWVLVDPRWSIAIDPKPSKAFYFITPLDVDSPDDPDLLYSYIPKLHVVIEPGDILFIPSYWWHDVRTWNSDHVMGMAIRASDWVLEKLLFDFLLLFDVKSIPFFYHAFIKGKPLTEAEDAVRNIDSDLKRLGVADSGRKT